MLVMATMSTLLLLLLLIPIHQYYMSLTLGQAGTCQTCLLCTACGNAGSRSVCVYLSWAFDSPEVTRVHSVTHNFVAYCGSSCVYNLPLSSSRHFE